MGVCKAWKSSVPFCQLASRPRCFPITTRQNLHNLLPLPHLIWTVLAHHHGLKFKPHIFWGGGMEVSILRQQQINSPSHRRFSHRRLLALPTAKLMDSIACVTWQRSCDIALQWSCRKLPRNCPVRRMKGKTPTYGANGGGGWSDGRFSQQD